MKTDRRATAKMREENLKIFFDNEMSKESIIARIMGNRRAIMHILKSKVRVYLWLLFCLPLHAMDISFQWDAGAATTNYLFYASTNGLSVLTNAVVRLNVGTNKTCTVQNLAPGIWTFGVTGIANDLETDLSNTLTIQVPLQPPGNFRTVFVDYGPAVVGPFTNVATFFRLRIP